MAPQETVPPLPRPSGRPEAHASDFPISLKVRSYIDEVERIFEYITGGKVDSRREFDGSARRGETIVPRMEGSAFQFL